jgi:hypothetical protein
MCGGETGAIGAERIEVGEKREGETGAGQTGAGQTGAGQIRVGDASGGKT